MKLMLHVWHKDSYRPVGKVFPHPKTGELIFLHEESGNQAHHDLSAPGGIDTVIIPDLHQWRVSSIYHFNRKEKSLYVTGLTTLSRHGTVQTSGGRKRIYLPNHYWHIDYFPAGLPFRPPWCADVRQYGGKAEGIQLGFPGLGLGNDGVKQPESAGGKKEVEPIRTTGE